MRLEVRLLADVGLVGLPNAGKSSLLRAMTQARPKIGAHPFTTLEPNVGIAEVGYDTFVLADIPGLIEGAHAGKGLGTEFLRHVQRAGVLIHVVDVAGEDPLRGLAQVRNELTMYGEGLPEKRWLVAANKIDLVDGQEIVQVLRERFPEAEVYPTSALTGAGLRELARRLVELVRRPKEVARVELRPAPVEAALSARLEDGAYRLEGQRAREVVWKLGADTAEAVDEVWRQLRRMGVRRALRRAGARPGDCVRIGDEELEWPG